MSSDVSWHHDRDKLWSKPAWLRPRKPEGSLGRGQPRTAISTLTQLLNYDFSATEYRKQITYLSSLHCQPPPPPPPPPPPQSHCCSVAWQRPGLALNICMLCCVTQSNFLLIFLIWIVSSTDSLKWWPRSGWGGTGTVGLGGGGGGEEGAQSSLRHYQYTTSMDINNTRYKRIQSLIQNHMRWCAHWVCSREENSAIYKSYE